MTEFITREEFEQFKLDILEEIAEDRKRTTKLELFITILYNILWKRLFLLREDLEERLKEHIPEDIDVG